MQKSRIHSLSGAAAAEEVVELWSKVTEAGKENEETAATKVIELKELAGSRQVVEVDDLEEASELEEISKLEGRIEVDQEATGMDGYLTR